MRQRILQEPLERRPMLLRKIMDMQSRQRMAGAVRPQQVLQIVFVSVSKKNESKHCPKRFFRNLCLAFFVLVAVFLFFVALSI